MLVAHPNLRAIDRFVSHKMRKLVQSISCARDVRFVPANGYAVLGQDNITLDEVSTLRQEQSLVACYCMLYMDYPASTAGCNAHSIWWDSPDHQQHYVKTMDHVSSIPTDASPHLSNAEQVALCRVLWKAARAPSMTKNPRRRRQLVALP